MAQRFKLGVQRGVIVTDVTENSLAAQQGIEREDVITEVDGKPVTDVKTFRDALNQADPKRGRVTLSRSQGQQNLCRAKSRRRRTPGRPLGLAAADCDQHDPADETDAAYDRRKTDPMTLGVLDFNRPKLGVFLFLSPAQAAVGETNNADDDKNDAIIPAGFTARMLQRSATGDQLDNENDQRDHEQKMNVSAENVEADKTKKPENQQNNKDGPEHKKPFV